MLRAGRDRDAGRGWYRRVGESRCIAAWLAAAYRQLGGVYFQLGCLAMLMRG